MFSVASELFIRGNTISWLRHNSLPALSVLLIWIAATRIFYVVLHDPMLGYGNQFDMGRTAACLDLWPNLPGGPRDVAYFDAPIEKHVRINVPSQRCYPSAEVALDWIALGVDSVRKFFAHGAFVDMRLIGLFKGLWLVFAFCIAQHALRINPKIAVMHAATVAAVIADPIVTLYLNTLYGEFVAVLGAYAAITGVVAVNLADRWTALTRLLFILGVACLAFSRVQHFLLPLFFIALIGYLRLNNISIQQWLRDRVTTCVVMLLLAAVSASSMVINARFLKENPIFHEVNRNNMLFGAFLPATAHPGTVINALGLPPNCVELVHSDFFRKALRGLSGACPEVLTISPFRLVTVFALEPRAMATFLNRGIMLASAWRVPYVGEVANAVMQRASSGPFGIAASADSVSRKLTHTGHIFFWVLPVVCGLIAGMYLLLTANCDTDAATCRAPRSGAVVFLALAVVVVSAWVSSLFGDGYSELARHVHLGLVAALSSWALLICVAIFYHPLQMLLCALLGATIITAAISAFPAASGRLSEPPDDATLSTASTLSGWVISPHAVVAVDIEQRGRLLIRADVTRATTFARYHPLNDWGSAFDFNFARSAMASKLEIGVPISVYAVGVGNLRELVDIRYWCVDGKVCPPAK